MEAELLKIRDTVQLKHCKVLRANRRIRIFHQNAWLVDTDDAIWVWEHDRYPAYWLPIECFDFVSALPAGGKTAFIGCGDKSSTVLPVIVHEFAIDTDTSEYVRILFHAVDQWYEEDEPIFVHPKDPFKRIDILPSRRRLRISIDGITLAETDFSYNLYETGLPARFYMPRTAAIQSLLQPSNTRSLCPYKGEAHYHHVSISNASPRPTLHKNLVWSYPQTTREVTPIAGMLCYFKERVDIDVDGKRLVRPITHFS